MRKHGFLGASVAAAVIVAGMALAAGSGRAAASKTYDPPRLFDGKTPDLRGIWQARGTVYLDIEGHPGEDGAAAAKSAVVDPADGKIPYKPEALKQRQQNFDNRKTADPSLKCDEAGTPRATYLSTPLQIIQSPGNFAIVYQDNHAFRIVYPESRPHFEGIDWWMGDSRGHWDGNTYVIDVTDLNDDAWLDASGNYHTDNLHVVERYTMLNHDTLQYEARMDDSTVYTQPWTIRVFLYRDRKPGARILEDECEQDLATGKRYHKSPVTSARQ
jgi:hypothetical protein